MGMPSQLTSELTVSTLGANQGLTDRSSRVRSLSITRCELLIPDLQQTELAEFRSHLEPLHELRRVECLFSEKDLHYSGRTQEHAHLMQQLSIGLGGVKFISATVVGSVRYDTAAYLGMTAYILSSSRACALFVQRRISTFRVADFLQEFSFEGRKTLKFHQKHTARKVRKHAPS